MSLMLESMKRMYETLAEESTENLEHEIVVTGRFSDVGLRHMESLESNLTKVNERRRNISTTESEA